MTTLDLLIFVNYRINKVNAFPVSSIGGITVIVNPPVKELIGNLPQLLRNFTRLPYLRNVYANLQK